MSEKIYTLDEIKAIAHPIAARYNIAALYLFGSYARGTATESSDIDLLVDTTGTKLTSLFSLGKLYCDLEDALGKEIDLITVSALTQREQMPSDKVFRETILNERVDIYVAA